MWMVKRAEGVAFDTRGEALASRDAMSVNQLLVQTAERSQSLNARGRAGGEVNGDATVCRKYTTLWIS